MADYSPPTYDSPSFNTSLFLTDGGGFLTLAEGDSRYLRLTGGTVKGYTVFNSGINVLGDISLNGSVVDLNSISGVTPGTATGSKALILDSSKNISTINSITSNTYYGTTANIQLMNCDILSGAINVNAPIFYAGGTQFINSTRDMSNINTITFAGTKRIQDVQTIDFNLSSLIYKTIMRKSTFTDAGIELYDTQFSSATHAMLSFKCGNAVSNYTGLKFYQPYNSDDIAGTAFGQSFQIGQRSGPSFGSGFSIHCTATSAGTYQEQDRINLSVNGGATPYIVLNPKFNQLHLFPQGLAELNTTYTQNVIIGEELLVRKTLCIGTSTDTGRLISALDSTMTANTSRYVCFGRDTSSRNQAELSFTYVGNNDTNNRLNFGFFGGDLMYLTAGGRLGLGTSSPSCGLDVATGETSVLFTNNIGVNTYSYAISANSWGNFGGGPFSANICARFRGSVWIQDRLWATSDRRLKKDIKPLDFSLDHYKKLRPVSYKWKNNDSVQLGLIAQDVKNVCSEAVSLVENENMKVESEDDIGGAQYTVDYNCINMMNLVAIKKLIDLTESLAERVSSLETILGKQGLLKALSRLK